MERYPTPKDNNATVEEPADREMDRPPTPKDSLSPPSSPHPLPQKWLERQGYQIQPAVVDLDGFTPINPPNSPRPSHATLAKPSQSPPEQPPVNIRGFTPINPPSLFPKRQHWLEEQPRIIPQTTSLMSGLTLRMPYECCCPHCPSYAREGYVPFKEHVKKHLVDGEWTCPACSEVFAKAQMTSYMHHLEELEGFIMKKKGTPEPTEAAKVKDWIGEKEELREIYEEDS